MKKNIFSDYKPKELLNLFSDDFSSSIEFFKLYPGSILLRSELDETLNHIRSHIKFDIYTDHNSEFILNYKIEDIFNWEFNSLFLYYFNKESTGLKQFKKFSEINSFEEEEDLDLILNSMSSENIYIKTFKSFINYLQENLIPVKIENIMNLMSGTSGGLAVCKLEFSNLASNFPNHLEAIKSIFNNETNPEDLTLINEITNEKDQIIFKYPSLCLSRKSI